MQIIKKNSYVADPSDIRSYICSGAFDPGDEIEIDRCLWRVLDAQPGEIFIWKHSGPGEDVVFNENGANDYENSDLQRYARDEFPKTFTPELLELVTEEGFNPLSSNEIAKYLPTEDSRIVTDECGDTVWWWTRSVYRGTTYNTWSVSSSGYASGSYVTYAGRFAPACRLRVPAEE